jgi:hypothetical protein
MYQPAMMAPAAGAGEPIVQSETASTAVIDGQQRCVKIGAENPRNC